MDNTTLHKLQLAEQAILRDIDDYCRKNRIQYSLYAGSALGAVRHKGFIPWDDDVDIIMTRGEYTKFCKMWEHNPIEGYYFQHYLNDRWCGNSHGKIRKNNTIFLSTADVEKQGHHGIWIDIFPVDKLLIGNTKQRSHVLKIGKAIILLTRANIDDRDATFFRRFARKTIRFLVPYVFRRRLLSRLNQKLIHNDLSITQNFEWVDMSGMSYMNVLFPADMVNSTTDISFSGDTFSIYQDYDTMLKLEYGDYLQLPPESDRKCKHSPSKIEF